MRKNLAIIYLLILTIGTIVSLYMPKVAATVEETEMIPDEAIRLRILANSDLEADQAVKRLIRDEVNKEITLWVEDLTSLDEARAIISSNIPKIEEIAERIIAEKGLDQAVSVKFGKAEFPTKLYGQYLYPAGEYEAIVVTLGAGEGANWWCVLFPPLCFLDFSNGTAVSQTPFEEGIEEPNGPVEKEIESSVKEKEVIKVPVEEKEETEISFEEKKETESSVEEKEVIENPVEEKKEAESSVEEKEVIENPVEEKKEAESSVEKKEETQTPIDVQVGSQSPLDDREELEEQSVLNQDQVAVQQESVYNGQEEEPIIVKSFFAELFSQLF
ncbi:stage II sporulation protein R [Peribacillus huizhouensis]|uniref:Stage II sporulation protein R n=1 Tax=Peribacillus huizhouensis TaxID=1501239 RepID=A0ABR6CS88_9BACI|nr:stage II sporulation protein R [Peribacillus huizhouensis]MBA9027886.1 stage II sporulation protein R [Peribacillus huizhouensis]